MSSLTIMLKALVFIACLAIQCSAEDNSTAPAPCSSEFYSLLGKCGGIEHAYLRCPKGYFCSQWGYCGTTSDYRTNALCPPEQRDDPAANQTIPYGFSPDDRVQDYLPQDDTEAEEWEEQIPEESQELAKKRCEVEKFHRFGKCGSEGHGNFRCKYGEWCNVWGFCSKFQDAAPGLCLKETRPNPEIIVYEPTPDDDPNYEMAPPSTSQLASNQPSSL